MSGYDGPVPPVNAGRVLGQFDEDGTYHSVIEADTTVNLEGIQKAMDAFFHNAGEVRITDPETGGQKGQKDEQYSLLPVGALAEVAKVYAYGAQKYSRNNWRLGYDWHLSYDAMQRHLNAFWGGEDLDPESGLPHLAHAMFHALTLLTYLNDPKYASKDDRA